MLVTRTAAWTLALILIAGCNSAKPATLCQADGTQVKVTILGKTGDSIAAPFVQALPSGTGVTILNEGSSDSIVKIRIEQGEFKGQEATVARGSIRVAQ
jgi:hypothetical protein